MSTARAQHIQTLLSAAAASFDARVFGSLNLSKPLVVIAPTDSDSQAAERSGAERILTRPVVIKGALHLCVVFRFATKDITKNLAPEAAWPQIARWLGAEFANAHLLEHSCDWQLITNRKGEAELRKTRIKPPDSQLGVRHEQASHNRSKNYALNLTAPFLRALGVTQFGPGGERAAKGADGGTKVRLVPAMANKYRQINKFLEIFEAALTKSALADSANLRVLDFGAGKGYLTFALDHFLRARAIPAETKAMHSVLGVELRTELVAAGNAVCEALDISTLRFAAGDIRSFTEAGEAAQIEVMVALHACDTATDFAIHYGIRAQASMILCAPCCHKQLRPQLQMPVVLQPLLKHGVHLGQEAEMLTDSLRALILETQGYQTQVFEFVATEHTAKNKMIMALRRQEPLSALRLAELDAQIQAIKAFYGISEHALEALLSAPMAHA